jgi:hypothetical protein
MPDFLGLSESKTTFGILIWIVRDSPAGKEPDWKTASAR